MKKTEYFSSRVVGLSQTQLAIDDVKTKRDSFLNNNQNVILNIEDENIQFVEDSRSSHILAILSLTYLTN